MPRTNYMYKIPPKYTNLHLTNFDLSSIIRLKATTKDTKRDKVIQKRGTATG